jgi:hypothetical protein
MEEDPPGKPDDGCLNQKRERRMGEGEIAIRHLPQGDARGAVKNVAQVPQNGKVRVLPQNHACRSHKQAASGKPVAQCPARLRRAGSVSHHPRR